MTKDNPTKLAKWKVTSERYGCGYPYGFITTGFGKSQLANGFGCSGVCVLSTIQVISFGPFYYQRKLQSVIPSYGLDLDERERHIWAAFEEIDYK